MTSNARDIVIVLAVAVIFMAGILFELAGLMLSHFHTISYYAYHFQPLRWTILGSILFAAVLWTWHSGHQPAR